MINLDLIHALAAMVSQHCFQRGDEYESQCLSANAEAMRLLCDLGVMEVVHEGVGRNYTAKFKPRTNALLAWGGVYPEDVHDPTIQAADALAKASDLLSRAYEFQKSDDLNTVEQHFVEMLAAYEKVRGTK